MMISEDKVRKIIREELLKLMEQEEPKPPALNDLEFMSDERITYEQWASRHGHSSAEVQSVLVDYIIHQGLQDNHDLHKALAKELGFDHAALGSAILGKLPTDTNSATEEDARELSLAQVVEAISKI